MHSLTNNTVDRTLADRRLLWLSIVVVGAAFFCKSHVFSVSLYADYAPWASDAPSASGGNLFKGISLSFIGLLGVYFLARKDGARLRSSGLLRLLAILYVAWCAASILWSIDQLMTARFLTIMACCFLGALGIARQLSVRDLPKLVIAITCAYLVTGLGTELVLGTFRPYSPDYRFAGTVHPNKQGTYMMMLCLAAFCLARSTPRAKRLLVGVFFVGFTCLLLTRSRTGCAGLLLAISAVWLVTASVRARLLAVLGFTWVSSAALLVGSLLGVDVAAKVAPVVLLGRQAESTALTGRIPIWNELAHYIEDRPLVGYGCQSFWTTGHIEAISEQIQFVFRAAHSAYIDAVLSVGLIGAAVLLLGVVLGVYHAATRYKNTKDPGCGFILGMLVFGLINAIFESGIIGVSFVSFTVGCGLVHLAFSHEPDSPMHEIATTQTRRHNCAPGLTPFESLNTSP